MSCTLCHPRDAQKHLGREGGQLEQHVIGSRFCLFGYVSRRPHQNRMRRILSSSSLPTLPDILTYAVCFLSKYCAGLGVNLFVHLMLRDSEYLRYCSTLCCHYNMHRYRNLRRPSYGQEQSNWESTAFFTAETLFRGEKDPCRPGLLREVCLVQELPCIGPLLGYPIYKANGFTSVRGITRDLVRTHLCWYNDGDAWECRLSRLTCQLHPIRFQVHPTPSSAPRRLSSRLKRTCNTRCNGLGSISPLFRKDLSVTSWGAIIARIFLGAFEVTYHLSTSLSRRFPDLPARHVPLIYFPIGIKSWVRACVLHHNFHDRPSQRT